MEHINSSEIQFKTHWATMSMSESRIYCFKYTTDRCDLEIFDNKEDAQEWLITPFPTITYYVKDTSQNDD